MLFAQIHYVIMYIIRNPRLTKFYKNLAFRIPIDLFWSTLFANLHHYLKFQVRLYFNCHSPKQGRPSWVGTVGTCPPTFCWNLNEMGQVPTHFFIPQWQHNSVWKILRLKIFVPTHFLEAYDAPDNDRYFKF